MTSPLHLDEYDVIICGGGTAGCVLANRLSEDQDLTVLVLEAGENANDDPRIYTPGLFPLLMDSERDWGFMSEPSPAMNGRRMAQPRGKCIGGSSAIARPSGRENVNLMALIYPSKVSIDAWSVLGNPGWSWDDLAPYYRKTTRRCPPSEAVKEALGLQAIDESLRNPGGQIASSFPSAVDPVTQAWTATWKNLSKSWDGYPLTDGSSAGGYIATAAVDPEKGERSHAGVGYYAPASDRKNVHVVTDALIDKIELDNSSDSVIATGVTFTHSGRSITAKVKQEIVLASGVFGSPAILERSGIGSKSLCNELGIENVIDNPNVGESLQDHIMGQVSYEVKDGVPTVSEMKDPAVAAKFMDMYQTSRSGPLAAGACYTLANTPLLDFLAPLPPGELEDLLNKYLPEDSVPKFPAEKKHYAFLRSVLESREESSASNCVGAFALFGEAEAAKDKFALPTEGYITMIPALSHPFSRGSVHIKSRDSEVYPKVSCNYFDHPLDVEILARHMMQCEVLATTPPLSDLLKPNGKRLPLGKDALTLERAIDLVKSSATSNYHPCGTCAMQPRELGGVVDARLRVYGVRGLRVCDASIFPIVVRGNIMTTVYAVAEKASDLLKEDLRSM